MKKILSIISILTIIISGLSISQSILAKFNEDLDPLVDVNITVDIITIRALDVIEDDSDPDFFVNIKIDDEIFTSPVWDDESYLYDVWSINKDVSDEIETVDIEIELWDFNNDGNIMCDISGENNIENEGYFVNIIYNIKTGHWYGDDYFIGDGSGYGRVCGSSDGSIYKDENDCELWFSIYQNDYDNDSLTYWMEVNVYGTDPLIDNTGEDFDEDGVPIEWEHKWGFNPLIWEDHANFDPDQDSLTNIEEFLVRNFSSDPFRQDVFLELDFMEESPDGISSVIPDEGKELLKNPFHRRNIVFHIDTGEVFGGTEIPYDDDVGFDEVQEIYYEYYLDNIDDNWKRGVFHYGLLVDSCSPPGYGFGFTDDFDAIRGYGPGTNAFIISSRQMEENTQRFVFPKSLGYYYGSAIMHEMGHNFGFRWGNPLGCDAQLSKNPWSIGFWLYGRYKSIMNYRYTYKIFDYSDGSHGFIDSDDWEKLDFSYFEVP